MEGLRTAKRLTRAADLLLWLFIGLVMAGPLLGFLTPELGPQYVAGFGLDLQSMQPQIQQAFSSTSALSGTHTVVVGVYNRWFFPASASLSLELIVKNSTVYQTETATSDLAPFQTGDLRVVIAVPPSVASQLQGAQVTVGGQLHLESPGFWAVTVNFPQR